jgi:signal transduction histidine kinase
MDREEPSGEAPRQRTARAYAATGALLGLGAPLGFLLIERVVRGRREGPGWLARSMAENRAAMAYMTLSTPVVFALFGRSLGRREEGLRLAHEHIEWLRDEFTSVVADELHNPAQAIRLQLQLLLRQARSGEARVPVHKLERLQQMSTRMARMISELLEASRVEAGRVVLMPKACSLPEVVNASIVHLGPTLDAHPVDVKIERPPPLVRADRPKLEQILGQLIENAAKFSEQGAPIVVRMGPSAGGARVAVEDRGPGIDAEQLPRLFDRFYQARRARKQKSGLGLGLYITKGLIEAHGGQLEVRSQPGRGSVFSVWLPAAAPA